MRTPAGILLLGLLLLGCGGETVPEATLVGRAVLPSGTLAGGPPAGAALEPSAYAPELPFPSQPVQGVSALLRGGPGRLVALVDNGFGSRENSADFRLRWYGLHFDLQAGQLEVVESTELRDPVRHLPFPIVEEDGARPLTGADLDPESFQQVRDGSFWVGDEFGPWLLRFDRQGRLLQPPVAVPLPEPFLPYGRGQSELISPQHPRLRGLDPAEALARANHPASKGLEGLALGLDGRHLYALLEGPLLDDPQRRRLLLQEFALRERAWTGRWWAVSLEAEGHSVGALTALDDHRLLLVERDAQEGREARFKRVYRIDLDRIGTDGFVAKELVCDLLRIEDPTGITQPEEGAVGLGRRFSFPFVTIEALTLFDHSTLLLANDNNYPFSSGRRPGLACDDTEIISVRLARDLRESP